MTVFVDTNVLVYARDRAKREKHDRARAWLGQLWRERAGRLSYQVLQEYYVTVTRKLSHPLKPREAREDVRSLFAWDPVTIDARVLEGAWSAEERLGVSFWDALIVSAATLAGCRHLLTEDLQDGQDIDGLVVVNPFLHEPASIEGR